MTKSHRPPYINRPRIRKALIEDLRADQAKFNGFIVGRPLADMIVPNADAEMNFWKHDINYGPENLLINYMLRREVRSAVFHHRTEGDFAKTIQGVAPSHNEEVLVQRRAIDLVKLGLGTDGIRKFGVVALCDKAQIKSSNRPIDLAEEADAVRMALLGEDADMASPQLWLGEFTARACDTEIAVEQLEHIIPLVLAVGGIRLMPPSRQPEPFATC